MEKNVQLLTEASGFLASIFGLLVWLPQGLQVWRNRHDRRLLAGISVQTQVLSLVGNALWAVHAVGIGSFWLGAPSVINIPVALLTIAVVRRSQRPVALTTGGPAPSAEPVTDQPMAPLDQALQAIVGRANATV